jgi:hypothetical protein
MEAMEREIKCATRAMEQYDAMIRQLEEMLRESYRKV